MYMAKYCTCHTSGNMPDGLVVVPLRWDNYELDFSLEKVNRLQIL